MAATATLEPLPPYPSSHARSQLSPSQLASLNRKIALSIRQALNIPVPSLNSVTTVTFISSYVRDTAQGALDALIWDTDSKTNPKPEIGDPRSIRVGTLLLAERFASTGVLDLITLLDLSIAYASHPTRLRVLFNNAFSSSSSILSYSTTSALPAFSSVLLSHANTGLHGLRKAAHTILCLLRAGPPELLRAFARDRDFVLAIAQAYDAGLGAAASSYGRLYFPVTGAALREPDDWELIFLHTKADLLDSFHILLTTLLDALAALSPGPSLTAEAERAFDIVFALHSLPMPTRSDDSQPTAFLNRSLLSDYQHAYDLSDMLSRALLRAAADDARLEVLSAALGELDADLNSGSSKPSAGPARRKDPGAFTLLLGSGVQHGIDNLGRGARANEHATTPGGIEAVSSSSSRALDPRVEEVRAILPDYTPDYVEALLQSAEYGSVQRVVEALLEGTAPPPKRSSSGLLLRDQSFMGQMKADILKRVEELSDSEEEEVNIFGFTSSRAKSKGKGREVAFDDEENDATDEQEEADVNLQTILELTYVANPKVFERDAATRRSTERAVLRARTGWVDEQIEGFKIMLERDPKTKERMLRRHEFSGNKSLIESTSSGPNSRSRTPDAQPERGRGGRGRGGRGQTRGHGRGQGRGAGHSAGKDAGGGGGGDAQSYARKNKNKARLGNNDRKRGHDKKMSRAGVPSAELNVALYTMIHDGHSDGFGVRRVRIVFP
ncbi:hypothetical protein B0F90DRAFT_1668998 [Multifurca ochricompacta]|uniref:CUE domain-containing protein n=1 Tax=Multifurca ochricompacta TaxID=376703 RepID=A0AAD4QJV3_9AGAM|nr:hypothetical protein B0F90DRAFT_1668998 [Multifurca ochricompacta]